MTWIVRSDAPSGSVEELRAELVGERRARQLLQAVAMADATTTVSALQAVVDAVCRVTRWPVGHALLRSNDGALVSSGVWHLAEGERFRRFREISDAATFRSGEGLPGRVVATGRPHWIMDVRADANFPRQEAAEDLGVRAAFGFPVVVGERVVAVLEFFAPEAHEPDEPLLEVMETLGKELAHTLERVAMTTELRQSELRFRSVALTSPDAIVTADGAGRIISFNQAAEKMFGYAEHEVLGEALTILIPESLREAHERGIRRVREGGERRVIGRTVELTGLHRSRREFPLELSLATWQIEGSHFYSGILRDVSDRKEIAARLLASEQAAQDASRAKTVFLANMSHELRTPLNAILGFVQLMGRDRTLSAEHRENLAVVLRSGEHLLHLINDVLSISKIEAGETELREVDFDLGRLVDSLRDLFVVPAQARGLTLLVESATSAPPFVHGDDSKLRQILINLIGNAIKFTSHGGVALRIAYDAGRAIFEVEDTGPGISPADQARLFQPFVQSEAGLAAHEGTGLGLAISRNFARLMGGSLELASTVGQGSRFRLEVPLREGSGVDARRSEGAVLGLAAGERARRVLVVDNADDNRLLLVRLLRSVGFLVEEAQDGVEAIAAWERFRPELVWMDMRMPRMNGYEATTRIRAAEAVAAEGAARTVIIALTASAFEQDRPKILAAGCDAIVAKPFREESIFEAFTRHLGVRFRREALPSPEESLAPSLLVPQLLSLDAKVRRELAAALSAGDDLAAQAIVDRLPAEQAPLASELGRLVKSFRLDELLSLLEEVGR